MPTAPARPSAPVADAVSCPRRTIAFEDEPALPCGEVGAPASQIDFPWSPSVAPEIVWSGCRNGDGQAHGPMVGSWRDRAGIAAVGSCRNGVRHGTWHYGAYEGGTFAVGRYLDGRREGTWLRFWGDGSVGETNYRRGKRHGPDRGYSQGGRVSSERYYRAGEPDGVWKERWSDGSLLRYESYDRGKRDGPAGWFYRNGRLHREGAYVGGKRDGVWQYWLPSGELRYVTRFRRGRKIQSLRCPAGATRQVLRTGAMVRITCRSGDFIVPPEKMWPDSLDQID